MATGPGLRSSRGPGATKNLRAISLSLVAKVRSQRVTTSTALANELAREAVAQCPSGFDGPAARAALEKNVRRRLYDSLKVLVSIGAISRVRRDKTLRWNGVAHLRRNNAGGETGGSVLEKRVAGARARVAAKIATLRALRGQGRAVRALCARNRSIARSGLEMNKEQHVHIPFVVVRTPERSKIHLDATPDAKRLKFHFDSYFEVINDSGIIHRLFPTEDEEDVLDHAQQPRMTLSLKKRMYAIPPVEITNGFEPVLPHEIGSVRACNEGKDAPEAMDELDLDIEADMEEEVDMNPWHFSVPLFDI